MKTPIVDFLKGYAARDIARFHMPGHKGRGALDAARFDITEVQGADVLYHADGVIADSMANATALFGTAATLYSTEGSTLAIKAMLALVAADVPKGARPRVLAARNAHKAFLYGAALLDMDITWLMPRGTAHLCACPLTVREVEKALAAEQMLPQAVYLTSPDYLGNVADVAGIAAVCKRYGVPLLVDNAHGAYLRFLSPSRHPMDLGATMCADSAHKTLSALTGAAYLHIAKDAPLKYVAGAPAALSLFASTSPSYLVLGSLDLCNRTLATGYGEALAKTVLRIEKTRKRLAENGLALYGDEPLKLTLDAAACGYTGEALADTLREKGIEPEFADKDFLVLMISPANTEGELDLLERALLSVVPQAPRVKEAPPLSRPALACTPREALLAPAEEIDVALALGRVLAAPTVACPPAVPILMSGEVIDAAAQALFQKYGVTRVRVLKE
ncbi:MAG: amino acid decarboxylase [Clostridia bacterium]|nr:amino acid decarboxylase [Clostridia bacterium]